MNRQPFVVIYIYSALEHFHCWLRRLVLPFVLTAGACICLSFFGVLEAGVAAAAGFRLTTTAYQTSYFVFNVICSSICNAPVALSSVYVCQAFHIVLPIMLHQVIVLIANDDSFHAEYSVCRYPQMVAYQSISKKQCTVCVIKNVMITKN